MAKAPRYYMIVEGDAEQRAITFGVNLRTQEAIYGFAFAHLLMTLYQGSVSAVARREDPPDVVVGSATITFASDALYMRALLDCQTYLTRDGRVLATYRAPLTRADPRLRQSQALLERARTQVPVTHPKP